MIPEKNTISVHVSNFRDFEGFEDSLRKEVCRQFDNEVLSRVNLKQFREFAKWFYQQNIVFSSETVSFYFKSFIEDKN